MSFASLAPARALCRHNRRSSLSRRRPSKRTFARMSNSDVVVCRSRPRCLLCRGLSGHNRVVLLFILFPPGESKPLRPKKLAEPHGPTSKQAHVHEDAELGRARLPVAARAIYIVSRPPCVFIFVWYCCLFSFPTGNWESKPQCPMKLAKPHGPTSKQAHLSFFALSEDAARADFFSIYLCVYPRAALSGLSSGQPAENVHPNREEPEKATDRKTAGPDGQNRGAINILCSTTVRLVVWKVTSQKTHRLTVWPLD